MEWIISIQYNGVQTNMIGVSCLKMMNKCCKKYSCSNWNTTAIIHQSSLSMKCRYRIKVMGLILHQRGNVWSLLFIHHVSTENGPNVWRKNERQKIWIFLWFSKWRLEYYEPRNQIVCVTDRFCLLLPLIECYAMEGRRRHWNDEYWLHVQPKWLHFSNHLNNVQI